MSQDTQNIGQASDQLNRVAAERQGWQGEDVETMAHEITDASDFSWRDRRANKQAMGSNGRNFMGPVEPIADHREPSMAAIQAIPPARD